MQVSDNSFKTPYLGPKEQSTNQEADLPGLKDKAIKILQNEEQLQQDPSVSLKKICKIYPSEGTEVKQQLFDKVFNIHKDYSLLYASHAGCLEAVKFYLEKNKNIDFSDNGITPLMLAAMEGHADVVQFLIENGADVGKLDIENHSALTWASGLNHPEVVKLLLNSKYYQDLDNPRVIEETGLCLYNSAGNPEVINIFLDHPKIKPLSKYAIASLINTTNFDLLKNILNKNPNLNFILPDFEGDLTPLMYAAYNDKKELAEFCLQNQADINFVNKNGSTALMFAAQTGRKDIVELLLKHGANVNTQTTGGSTALIFAAKNGHKEVAEILIENNANINTQTNVGMTAIHWAAAEQHPEVTNLLFEKGAKLDTQVNKKDRDTLYYEIKKNRLAGYKKIVKKIKDEHPKIHAVNDVIIAAKRINHTIGIEGKNAFAGNTCTIEGHKIDLNGYSQLGWIKFMGSNAKKTNEAQNPQLIALQNMLDTTSNLNEMDAQAVLDLIQNGNDIMIPTGWHIHAVTIIIKNGLLCIINRNQQPPADVYECDVKKLTVDQIQLLKNSRHIKDEDTFYTIIEDLISKSCKKTELAKKIEEHCPFPVQSAGNCTYASPEAANLTFLLAGRKKEIERYLVIIQKLIAASKLESQKDNLQEIKNKILEFQDKIQAIIKQEETRFLELNFNARATSIDMYLEACRKNNVKLDTDFLKKAIFFYRQRCLQNLSSRNFHPGNEFYDKCKKVMDDSGQAWEKEMNLLNSL